MDKPTIGSLFAGGGGIDLGFERAGFTTVWQVEQDEYCRKVLAKNFPHADRSITDVRSGNSSTLSRVDVIAGGFPCQDISIAGRGIGITGTRSGLWKEMHRIIGGLRPRYVLVENVPMLLKRGIDVVLGDLAEIGYDAEWEIISAADVGAPHLRERVWIVAYPRYEGVYKRRIFTNALSKSQKLCGNVGDGLPRIFETQSKVLANTYSAQRKGNQRSERVETEYTHFGGASGWSIEPDVDRVAYGIPKRVDRLRLLGNAVVPQILEWIAGQILKDMNRPENGQGG